MKFSFSLLRQLVPGIKNKKEIIEKLNLITCEAADAGGNAIEGMIPANRFSDLASHQGMAQEIAAITGRALKKTKKEIRIQKASRPRGAGSLVIKNEEPELCPRYAALVIEGVRVAPSPKWLKDILRECGVRAINNIVDIMNYVMLETGQPLHAFDYEKIAHAHAQKGKETNKKEIVVRRAKHGEKITTLEGISYELGSTTLVIADSMHALAIAGIKGGTRAEVSSTTKKIVIEAANFEGSAIYETARALKLVTDASTRFSHQISGELVQEGLARAVVMIKEIAGGSAQELHESRKKASSKKIFEIESGEWNARLGISLDIKRVKNILTSLGFEVKIPATKLTRYPITRLHIEVPAVRMDIETHEDVIEEIGRGFGLNAIPPKAPRVHITPAAQEDMVAIKDKTREILKTFGASEIYNYSFMARPARTHEGEKMSKIIELQNPITEDKKYLRADIGTLLVKNLASNLRFFATVKIFEIGAVFMGKEETIQETVMLGIAYASRQKETQELFLEIKGMVDAFFKKMGLVEYLIVEDEDIQKSGNLELRHTMRIESGGEIVGRIGVIPPQFIENTAGVLVEINLEKLTQNIEGEHEHKPIAKYPSVMRDISVLVREGVKIGDIMQAIQLVDRVYIEDVDLIDEYRESLTFRIVFQAEDRTLTDQEVNEKMKKIVSTLQSKFHAQIR